MQVLCEVTGRTLDLRGPLYAVGDRLMLDTDNPLHRDVLAHEGDWVRRIETQARPAPPAAPEQRGAAQPQTDRMVTPEARTPLKQPAPKGPPAKTVTK